MKCSSLVLCLLLMGSVAFGQAPAPGIDGVVNAASSDPSSPIAPGTIVSLYGTNFAADLLQPMTGPQSLASPVIPLETSLGGLSVKFNGVTAPLFFVSLGLVNAQVPWEVAGAADLNVEVMNGDGQSSAPQQLAFGEASPGIFTLNFGPGPAVVVNFPLPGSDVIPGSWAQPESLVIPNVTMQPAAQGGVIIVWANGLGAVQTAVPSGGIPAPGTDVFDLATVNPVTVYIGGVEAATLFAGIQSSFVGLYQINVTVPANAPIGDAVSIELEVAGVRSRNDATIAVRAAPVAAVQAQ